jgi:hypothetical protein
VNISILNFTVLVGGKYLTRKFSTRSFQVMMDLAGNDFTQDFAISLREKRKSLKLISSLETPFILKVSQVSKKLAM